MLAGRPKKTLNDLPENWESIILNMKKDGCSDVEVRCELNISDDLWYRFIKEEPSFSLTVKKGKDLCEKWWLEVGRKGIFQTSGPGQHTNVNPALWYMNMKNRFGWRDKQEFTGKDGEALIPSVIQIIGDKSNGTPKQIS